MKSLACRDVGMKNCDWQIKADSEEEILKRAEEHAREFHGIEHISDDLKQQVRSKIKDIKAA